ncbi:MAG TPA: putative sulfate exporter family transporter, partial [Pseudonocardia sp.]|nr:putative sulfate exporter family transporter [Pseudonocardia sp.]
LAASIIATIYIQAVGPDAARPYISTVNDLRTLFLILAFVSIGLEFRVAPLKEAGWRPVGVFASATVVNLLVGLGLAALLFTSFPA